MIVLPNKYVIKREIRSRSVVGCPTANQLKGPHMPTQCKDEMSPSIKAVANILLEVKFFFNAQLLSVLLPFERYVPKASL